MNQQQKDACALRTLAAFITYDTARSKDAKKTRVSLPSLLFETVGSRHLLNQKGSKIEKFDPLSPPHSMSSDFPPKEKIVPKSRSTTFNLFLTLTDPLVGLERSGTKEAEEKMKSR